MVSPAPTAATSETPHVRADARRNRELILEAARAAFSTGEKQVSLEAIARDAGVGIGTLYRNFPTREALVEVVHRDGLTVVLTRADELIATHDPATALRLWMNDYADFVGRKRGMAESLRALSQAGVIAASDTRTLITETLQRFLDAGARSGALRGDVLAEDVAASMLGVLLAADSPRSLQEGRMLDLLFAGIRAPESQT
jgi:AcrR family transcriptional regulator